MPDEHIHEEFEKDARFAVLSEAENLAKVGGWEWDIVKNKWPFSDNWLRIQRLNGPGRYFGKVKNDSDFSWIIRMT